MGAIKKLSQHAVETLWNLGAVDEAIQRDSGVFARYEANCLYIASATDIERLAKSGLCLIEQVGESRFAKITDLGRDELRARGKT